MTLEPAFERDVHVLERQSPSGPTTLRSPNTIALIFVGLVGFLVMAKTLAGFLIVASVGAFVRARRARWLNAEPARRIARVRVDADLVAVDGTCLLRTEIADGYITMPRAGGDAYHVSLRLIDARSRVRFEAELPRAEAREILARLGLDAADRSVAFAGGAPVFASSARRVGVVVITFALLVGAALELVPEAAFGAWVLALIACWLLPSTIVIRPTGVAVRWLGRERFIARDAIKALSAEDDATIRIRLASGGDVVVLMVNPDRRSGLVADYARHHRDIVLVRMHKTLALRGQDRTPVTPQAVLKAGTPEGGLSPPPSSSLR